MLDLQRDNDNLRQLVESRLKAPDPAALHPAGAAAKPVLPVSKLPPEGIDKGLQAKFKEGTADARRVADDLAAELDAVAALLTDALYVAHKHYTKTHNTTTTHHAL